MVKLAATKDLSSFGLYDCVSSSLTEGTINLFNMDKPGMAVVTASSIRGIVNTVNELGIQKKDIVTILKNDDQYLLIYFS
jgi:hypothetical protein